MPTTPDVPRCEAARTPVGLSAVIRLFDLGSNPPVRCSLPAGHPGNHEAYYQPFPGFADEAVVWPS
jgi:hypothetical protein